MSQPYFTPMQEAAIEADFWKRVREDASGCWLWTGAYVKQGMGYGRHSSNGFSMWAHRFAYVLANGPVPDGLFVLHSCDVPLCVNPAHLRAGTQRENMDEMIAKGRLQLPPDSTGRRWTDNQRQAAKLRIQSDPEQLRARREGGVASARRRWEGHVPQAKCSKYGHDKVPGRRPGEKWYCPECERIRGRVNDRRRYAAKRSA